MNADKKFTIKIKSKAEKRLKVEPEVEMITQWNLQRILLAVIVFIVIIILSAYYFNSQQNSAALKNVEHRPYQSQSTQQQDIVSDVMPEEIAIQEVTEEITNEPAIIIPPVSSVEPIEKKSNEVSVVEKELVQQSNSKDIVEPEILNPHVTRARLAKWVNKLEPHGQVDLPFLVDNEQATGFFYFTEVSDLQGRTVIHEWLREGESIYKHKFMIRGRKGRIYTSKLFTYKTTGQWQVRLITQQGEVLHKIDFAVENR